MKKKEVLLILVLAVLVTGGSGFIYFPAVVMPFGWGVRGLPIPYWINHGGTNLFILLFDFLFWFLVIFALWRVVKWARRKKLK